MTRDEFIDALKEEFDRQVELSRAKNSDYASNDDPFANFRLIESVSGRINAEEGILVRMTDKLQRYANLISRPPSVTDESIEDTLRDLSIYATIALILRREKRGNDGRSAAQ